MLTVVCAQPREVTSVYGWWGLRVSGASPSGLEGPLPWLEPPLQGKCPEIPTLQALHGHRAHPPATLVGP